ncbi:MFS transporter [Falsiroseomonas stagni]|uniref:Predicted arabinose efflux permease, MFS family n=1 Tax=Falsiroseomonas stagni DSM 19981 TaxID=1123062 RepID=A0A1I4A8M7_9PROT|nr:MFS transporter [Falsiroseomonas stagni]SFK52663.1 Predicted arabinose efflux permease, MFS family [Falsiroseomonas stagni DSM 19981]
MTHLDSRQSWIRLSAIMALSTLGGAGMWSVVVALPFVQAEFGATRADASLPYTLTMVGFAAGGILMGRLSDRFGAMIPVMGASCVMGIGYILAGVAPSLMWFALIQGVLIGALGSSASFGPLMADASMWFLRRRGIAVALAASGNYLAGVVWPPLLTVLIGNWGWRVAHIVVGCIVLVTMPLIALMLRARPPVAKVVPPVAGAPPPRAERPLGMSKNTLTGVLGFAGIGCCIAMAMPQVHIVAYCGDLGYGVARGTEMLSLMLAFGIVSRIASGFIADRIGGLRTLLLGSLLQGAALVMYLGFDSLFSLYVISALFGLFQGGIVPSYAIIVREYFPAREAGTRLGIVLMATLAGMAIGGWVSGFIFDLTGSYAAAFLNGVAWNLVNVIIVTTLLIRAQGMRGRAAMA